MQHELKTWPEYYQAVRAGTKTFEVRIEKPGQPPYQVGDTLWLREWDPDPTSTWRKEVYGYTGRSLYVTVTYVLREPNDLPIRLQEGAVVMAIRLLLRRSPFAFRRSRAWLPGSDSFFASFGPAPTGYPDEGD